MNSRSFAARYPGAADGRYTLTDIAHAVRYCSHGNLGDTFWAEVTVALADREPGPGHSAGAIVEVLSEHCSEQWVEQNVHHLLSGLEASRDAGGITWELVPVGRTGNRLMWRPVSNDEQLAEFAARTAAVPDEFGEPPIPELALTSASVV